MNNKKGTILLFTVAISFADSYPLSANTRSPENHIYRTLEEKRDAATKHAITSWFEVSPIIEYTATQEQLIHPEGTDTLTEYVVELEIVAEISLHDSVSSELVLNYDSKLKHWSFDEATLSFEHSNWEIMIGKQILLFGEYFSHFPTGPIIEFAETTALATIFTYKLQDETELSFGLYKGEQIVANTTDELDWVVSLNLWPEDSLSMGFSYISDIADSDQLLLDKCTDCYTHKIAAVSSYFMLRGDSNDVVLECVITKDNIQDLDPPIDRPQACNLEYTHYVSTSSSVSVRAEKSKELEETPHMQYGIAVTWHITNDFLEQTFVSLEYLQGHFESGNANDDNDISYEYLNTMSLQISTSF